MKTYYVLLAFGIFLCLFGLLLLSAPYYSSTMMMYSQPNYAGMFGFFMLLSGILVSIVSGILIERDRKSQQPSVSIPTVKKFCKYCGNEIEEDSVFCEKCGKKITI